VTGPGPVKASDPDVAVTTDALRAPAGAWDPLDAFEDAPDALDAFVTVLAPSLAGEPVVVEAGSELPCVSGTDVPVVSVVDGAADVNVVSGGDVVDVTGLTGVDVVGGPPEEPGDVPPTGAIVVGGEPLAGQPGGVPGITFCRRPHTVVMATSHVPLT